MYLQKSTENQGGAVDYVEQQKKSTKHVLLEIKFLLFSLQTLGPLRKNALQFFNYLGSQVIETTNDDRATNFLI